MNNPEELSTHLNSWGYSLTEQQKNLFEQYQKELIKWNDKVNLTRITDKRAIYIQHFLDSLMILKHITPNSHDWILDIGTGAGFPGIPIKIVLPDTNVDLLESKFKKTRFLNRLTKALSIEGVSIYNHRAEELAHDANLRESFSMVVTRAVSSISTIAELSLPFLKIHGKLYIWKTDKQFLAEKEEAKSALEVLHGEITSAWNYNLPGIDTNYVLVEINKVARVDDKYPRNVGIPEKRPL